MRTTVLKSVGRVLALGFVASLPVALAAQAAPSAKGSSNDSPSRFDIFAGYSYLAPKGTVNVPQAGGTSTPYSYDAVNVGAIASGSYFFNRFVGAQVELAEHEWGGSVDGTNIGQRGNDDGFSTFSAGLIFRFPAENITPFVHALVGGAYVDGPDHNGYQWGPDLTVGGGMDYETPWFDHRLAIRIFQADYEYMHADFGPQAFPPGGRANVNAARLSAGLVFHVSSLAPPPPVTLSCSASPESVFPGEPVTITATAGGLNPKDHVIYALSGEGVTATDNTAKVDTSSLAPGQHTVNCNVKEGKPGKEGVKPWETAQATASYTVKEFEPPTISCTASPTTIQPGGTSTITSVGVSPQNRPLTYSYSASAGTISGTGTTAEYSSAGAPTGAAGITCNVSDDKGHSASASTSVTIEAPPPPPQPHTQALCSINFTTDKRRPTRVDNEAKACLDQVALDLKQQADAKAVLVGQSDDKEKAITAKQEKYAQRHKRAKVEDFAAQRAVNAKDYLVTEQGIDGSRISTATVPTDGQTVQNYLVPAGADFNTDVSGTTPVDETQIKPEVRKPLPERHHHKAAQ
jgi:hypothetical protein